jgi:hypothetical protein
LCSLSPQRDHLHSCKENNPTNVTWLLVPPNDADVDRATAAPSSLQPSMVPTYYNMSVVFLVRVRRLEVGGRAGISMCFRQTRKKVENCRRQESCVSLFSKYGTISHFYTVSDKVRRKMHPLPFHRGEPNSNPPNQPTKRRRIY